MRSAIWTLSAAAMAVSLSAAGPVARAADAPAAAPADDREEIIVTHSKLGPLSDWAQMQAHNSEYRRLKAKFDPSPNRSGVDAASADRALGAPPGQGERSYQQELRDQPTAPAVKAVEDAVAPP